MSGAFALVAGWDLRRRGRRVVFLVVLVGVVGACVLATVAGARRSSTALTRFKASSRSADLELAAAPTARQVARLRRLPGVAAVAALPAYGLVISSAPEFQSIGAATDREFGRGVDRDRLIAGRRPDPGAVREITIGEGLANRLHVTVGSFITAESFTPEQIAATLSGVSDVGPRAGPTVKLRVVGIARRPLDLGEQAASGGLLVLTPAFAHEYDGRIGVFGTRIRVRTEHGASDVPSVIAGARRVLGPAMFIAQGLAVESQGARNAIDVIALALWIAAAVIAVAGLVAVAIVVSREISGLADDLDRMRELGCTRAQRIRMGTASALVVALCGAAVAVVGAAALSPLFPLGVARRADPDVGVHVDWVVAAAGFAAVVVAVAAIAVAAAVRVTRPGRDRVTGYRTSTIAARAAAAGATPSVSNGLRLALERGRGRTAVPVRSAAVGAVLGVLGVTAVLVFGASLDALVDAPARYGAPWDFQLTDETANTPCGAGDYGLGGHRGIAALTEVCTQNVQLDGRPVGALAYTRVTGRPFQPEIVAGRAPRGHHEVALGGVTLDALHKGIGDTVHAQGRSARLDYRVVGQVVFPTLSTAQPLADGAAFTGAGYAPLFDQNLFMRHFVGSYAPGADRTRVRQQLDAVPQLTAPTRPLLPVEIDRLRQIDWLPVALTLLLGAFALLAVGHGLVTGVRRRRRELALLKTLGFERRQVRATIGWQATTLAAIGVVVGVPLGVVVGSLVWRAVADGLGIDASPSIPVLAVAATAAGAVVLARAVAWWPARAAGRVRPAVALRSE